MRSPHLANSVRALLRLGNYVLARLVAFVELLFIHEEFQEAQTSLAQAHTQHESALDASDRTAAARDLKRDSLRQAMRTAGHMIRRAAGNDVSSQIYLKYFPNGTADAVGRPLPVEIGHAKDVITKLQTETDPLLQSQVPILTSAVAEMEASLRQHEDALAEVRRTRALLLTSKQNWINAYRTTHSRLRIHFATNPGRAESFFRPYKKANNIEEPGQPAQTQTPDLVVQDQGASVDTAAVSQDESQKAA